MLAICSCRGAISAALPSPTLLSAVAATRELLNGAPVAELADYFKLMAVFDVVFISGGLMLFGTLVER